MTTYSSTDGATTTVSYGFIWIRRTCDYI